VCLIVLSLYINHLIVSLCSSPSATIMQSGLHKSVEANALYVDPTVQALAHRSKVLQYNPDRDGVQEDGKLVYIDVELAKEHVHVRRDSTVQGGFGNCSLILIVITACSTVSLISER
jgi:hypothetical protein